LFDAHRKHYCKDGDGVGVARADQGDESERAAERHRRGTSVGESGK
jgi:hypothetical protein